MSVSTHVCIFLCGNRIESALERMLQSSGTSQVEEEFPRQNSLKTASSERFLLSGRVCDMIAQP